MLPRLCRPLSGFLTLSAVFSLPSLVALFHATSAPRISVFRAFPSSSAAISLDIRCSLVVSPAPRCLRLPGFIGLPFPSVTRLARLPCKQRRVSTVHLCTALNFSLAKHPAFAECPVSASGPCNTKGCRTAFPRCAPHFQQVDCGDIELAKGVDFRALIRRRVRS